MTTDESLPRTLVDQIYDGFFERLKQSDLFTADIVERLQKLRETGQLDNVQSIERNLEEKRHDL